MKLIETNINFTHFKQFSLLFPDIKISQLEPIVCDQCAAVIGKVHLSDPYGFFVVCKECLDKEAMKEK